MWKTQPRRSANSPGSCARAARSRTWSSPCQPTPRGDAQPIADGERLPPAFYGRRGGWRADWWTLLHPPYTLWHVSYAVIGAGLAPHLDWLALAATAIAFFLAVGIAAHALDEFHGRPL